MKKRILILAAVALVVALSIGVVAAYASKAVSDKTPPVTTSTLAARYVGLVSFDLHSTDASGVSYIYYRFDKDKVTLVTVPTDAVHTSYDVHVVAPQVAAVDPHPFMIDLPLGTHVAKFWAQDTQGNVEAQHDVSFTVYPALAMARSAAVVPAGKTFALSGTLKPGMAAKVAVQAKAPGATAYRSLATVTSERNGAFGLKYKTLKKGTWSFRSVYDNPQLGMKATSAAVKVTVK